MKLREYLVKRRARKLFPKQKSNFWYCGEFYGYQYQLYQAKKPWKSTEIELPCETFLVNPFQNHGKIKEGSILPCIKLNGWLGFYEVTKSWYYSSPGSDFASWDDGKNINLELHHIEKCHS